MLNDSGFIGIVFLDIYVYRLHENPLKFLVRLNNKIEWIILDSYSYNGEKGDKLLNKNDMCEEKSNHQ